MQFEWDEDKNKINFARHGIWFNEAKLIFDGIVLTKIDTRKNYSEIRELSIGSIQGFVVIVVIHTERDSTIRIISARKATRKERKRYYDYIGGKA